MMFFLVYSRLNIFAFFFLMVVYWSKVDYVEYKYVIRNAFISNEVLPDLSLSFLCRLQDLIIAL